jgi:hypothetical protein
MSRRLVIVKNPLEIPRRQETVWKVFGVRPGRDAVNLAQNFSPGAALWVNDSSAGEARLSPRSTDQYPSFSGWFSQSLGSRGDISELPRVSGDDPALDRLLAGLAGLGTLAKSIERALQPFPTDAS